MTGYLLLAVLFLFQQCRPAGSFTVRDTGQETEIATAHYTLRIQKAGFRFQFLHPDGAVIAPAHAQSGIQIGKNGEEAADVKSAVLTKEEEDFLEFTVETAAGLTSAIVIRPQAHTVKIEVRPGVDGLYDIIARTGGAGPAYGMGDHAAFGPGRTDLVLEDFVRDPLGDNNGTDRMVSNFVVFPQQGFAVVNMEPGQKVIRITGEENAQGARGVRSMPALYYFVGSPVEIYEAYLAARNAEGYRVDKPKPEWFGVGWEAFGALAWMTNQETVTGNVDQYLDYGYPLSWMVVGSGFWPRGPGEFDEHGTPYGSESASEEAKKLQATTSFGMWDEKLYPDPRGLIDHFHERGLIFTIGLRIGFIPGGPFSGEGLENDYFIKDDQGAAELFKIGFPRVPIYLLDTKKPAAVDWYVSLCDKWAAYGVDGYKEDLFGWPLSLPDDLIDPVNRALMDRGVYIMGRNNYLGSPADIHRYNDFNYNQSQDRGPINGLAYAFSGFPYVYPDIIGGTGLATGRFGQEPPEKLRTYLIRYAQYAALNPSMAFGYGPWNFDEQTNALCLQAAQLHHRLAPYIYSNAVKAYQTGFPYTMTPLPLAYPDDPNVYGLADTVRRSYEWLIGESLLAAPLYGDDYDRSFSRDIYLPAGKWIDYETGEIHQGAQTLKGFEIPVEKIPLFVGGDGFVVEKRDEHLVGRVYPLNQQVETVFWHTDGETQSKIRIDVRNWEELTVVDATTGEKIDHSFVRHAYEFVLEPGRDYKIQ
jgi:hypothetical protein